VSSNTFVNQYFEHMNIYLLGYMGSGKSTIGPLLADHLSYEFLDFDDYVEEKEKNSISTIFKDKGEIYFRKAEHKYLKELLSQDNEINRVVALGGGTPCYSGNMDVLDKHNTIYLNVSFQQLSARLWKAREHRPLISSMKDYEQLEDYVRKHLFERSFYYNQANIVLKVGEDTAQEMVTKIINKLF